MSGQLSLRAIIGIQLWFSVLFTIWWIGGVTYWLCRFVLISGLVLVVIGFIRHQAAMIVVGMITTLIIICLFRMGVGLVIASGMTQVKLQFRVVDAINKNPIGNAFVRIREIGSDSMGTEDPHLPRDPSEKGAETSTSTHGGAELFYSFPSSDRETILYRSARVGLPNQYWLQVAADGYVTNRKPLAHYLGNSIPIYDSDPIHCDVLVELNPAGSSVQD